ncbi:hypothetical protein [Rathayibacter soli]|uniref:hypothetical protein n=1 Tax=Rathayibacter soli TaxID=3144168 RepID=UPI0027E420E9|nr:hypothetical protein [Glaciibacter superstes]
MTTRSDAETVALMKSRLYTPVVGDILDDLGRTHLVPSAQGPPSAAADAAGRAMPAIVTDVYGMQGKPFGLLTDALDQLEPGEVYLSTRVVQPVAI